MKYIPTTIFIFILTIVSNAQTSNRIVDTISIYKNKTGVSYRIYLKTWFRSYGIGHSYSYVPKKINKQDSLVMLDTLPHYFKIYNRTNKLLFEGKNGGFENELIGNVIYHYKNGTKKRIEHWNHIYTKDTCNYSIILNDASGKEGIWSYYRRNGKVKKKLVYTIYVLSCEPINYYAIKTITKYKINGRPKRSRIKKVRV